jgi:hypothetical protein
LNFSLHSLVVPWTTCDLAAHLVQREHDHLAGPGLVLPGAWARFAEQRRKALALGPSGELLLYLFGRPSAAPFDVTGPAAAVEAVRRARFGL